MCTAGCTAPILMGKMFPTYIVMYINKLTFSPHISIKHRVLTFLHDIYLMKAIVTYRLVIKPGIETGNETKQNEIGPTATQSVETSLVEIT